MSEGRLSADVGDPSLIAAFFSGHILGYRLEIILALLSVGVLLLLDLRSCPSGWIELKNGQGGHMSGYRATYGITYIILTYTYDILG